MTLPPQSLTARYNSWSNVIARRVAPTSDTPEEIYIGQSHSITGVRQILPGNPTGLTFSTCTISHFAGALASVCGAFISTAAYDNATASTSVTAPSQSHGSRPGLNPSGPPGLPPCEAANRRPDETERHLHPGKGGGGRASGEGFFPWRSGGLCLPG